MNDRYTLLHDTDDSERQGLAIRKMYRTLAPQITENPIFMHLTDTSPAGVRSAVDQCAEVGINVSLVSFFHLSIVYLLSGYHCTVLNVGRTLSLTRVPPRVLFINCAPRNL
jgi:hypothetical protein